MRTVALVILTFTTHLYALKCPDPGPSWADTDKTEAPGTKYRTFSSEAAKTVVSYLVYLPPDYDVNSTQRYPVVYWLHGMCGHAWNGSGFVNQLDQAIRSKQAPPMIAVLVNGMADSYYFDSPDPTNVNASMARLEPALLRFTDVSSRRNNCSRHLQTDEVGRAVRPVRTVGNPYGAWLSGQFIPHAGKLESQQPD